MNTIELTFAKAIADDTRQEMMKHLCCVWLSVNDLVEKLQQTEYQVNQPTVSHHLKILQEANLVVVWQEGRQRFYTLNEEHFTMCCGQLMQRFAPSYATSMIPIDQVG